MTVEQFIKSLLTTELANSGLSYIETAKRSLLTRETLDRPASLSPDTVHTFITLLNEGIQEVYTLFPFLRKRVFIREMEGKSVYKLSSQFSRAEDMEAMSKYIMDSPLHPYENDLIKILDIQYACSSPDVNTVYSCSSAIINNITSIYDPYPIEGRVLDITYQARPALLKNIDIFKDEEVQQSELPAILSQFIDIPSPLFKVLRAYAAFKFYMQTPVLSNSGATSDMYQAYTNALKEVQEQNLTNNSLMYPNTLLEQKGFI